MNKLQRHRNVVKERLTILLVFFFCILISSSEYIIDDSQAGVDQEQQASADEGSAEQETFFSASVDAVVPFVFTTVDHAFHLIYELVGFEAIVYSTGAVIVKHPTYFSEILLERIISTNAP
jgi:hypothetical protein